MGFLEAKEHLKKYNFEDRIIEFSISTATVKEAADALHSSEGEIAKSLAFLLNDDVILVIVAGDKKIDNSKYKHQFGLKAKMIAFDEVEELVGHRVGGVCPFGIKKNVNVYLDVSLKEYKIVYPACGSHNTAVRLSIGELEKVSNYIAWVDVCK